jgi:hypothetical protein
MKLVATDTKVTIKWFVYDGNEKVRHNSTMRGNLGLGCRMFLRLDELNRWSIKAIRTI